MQLLDIVKKRKSVRSFADITIERENILECLEAARLAPSSGNIQPWYFIVVDDVQLKNELCKAAFSGIYKSNNFCISAPVIIVVLSERSAIAALIGKLVRNAWFYLVDIGIAVEHFVLQAEELGLGTCWIGWFNEKAVKKVLSIPRNKKIDIILAVGYPTEISTENNKWRKPINEIYSFNSYSSIDS